MPTETQALLSELQRNTFAYFQHEYSESTGLIRDKTGDNPSSIAATGLALACYPVAIYRGLIAREEALHRTLTLLRFLESSEQSTSPGATGYKGFYYHFLDMETGRRAWRCELSTLDTTLLIAGILAAAMFFDSDSEPEAEVRRTADKLYRRVDWQWALNKRLMITHGWRHRRGFIRYRYAGYTEALIMYFLAMGSPTYPIEPENYQRMTTGYRWKKIYDRPHVYAGPLFIHQLSHLWVDFRGIQDDFMRRHGIDYFENSRRATYIHREYAIHNPKEFKGYDGNTWGISASDGPGPKTRTVDGRRIKFYDYRARGVPFGPDDGTLAPWAAVASLPFAPEIVLPTIHHLASLPRLAMHHAYGFRATFNPTFPSDNGAPWVSPYHIGLDEGPIMLMVENYCSDFVWNLMKKCTCLIDGLRKAGFRGGWLE